MSNDRIGTDRVNDGIIIGTTPLLLSSEMTNDRLLESEEQVEQQLLPRIPDEVTLNYITTKLSWRAIDILSSVSTAWRKAIRSRQVYEARLRSQSLETLVVHSHCSRNRDYELLCLYSVRDKRCYELPGIPMVDRGIPWLCQCISVDGKIYVLGGTVKDRCHSWVAYPNVYVLDVAVGMQWKKCASMEKGRHSFGCGVVDGKVYVFGGAPGVWNRVWNAPANGTEVYNPEKIAWSITMPMIYLGSGHRVNTKGEELLLHSGQNDYQLSSVKDVFSVDSQDVGIYHPGKDEWRLMNPSGHRRSSSLFMLEGQFYLMTELGIDVHDTDKNAWGNLHFNSFDGFGSMYRFSMVQSAAVLVNDELFVKASFERAFEREMETWSSDQEICSTLMKCSSLMKSKGFRSKTHEIVWSAVSCDKVTDLGAFICPIQL